MACVLQLLRAQAKQGSCDSGAPPSVPAHNTVHSRQAASSQQMSTLKNNLMRKQLVRSNRVRPASSNRVCPASSMMGLAMQSGMSDIVATVQAARAQHQIHNQEVLLDQFAELL